MAEPDLSGPSTPPPREAARSILRLRTGAERAVVERRFG
jgi:hypothetical protein